MRRLLLAVALVAAVSVGGYRFEEGPGTAVRAEAPRVDLAQQLRYIGRDTSTGMPAPVDDRFIADTERAIERYGLDAGAAVPPPPVTDKDIVSISVARLGLVDATVARFGLDAFGRLDVPQDASRVGWNPGYTDVPGEGGATFLAAHYEYGGRPGVFYRLSTMVEGDEVTVTLSDGASYRYRVTSKVDYNLASIDMGAILYGREGRESITLMTCSGPAGPSGYLERTVVLAERVA